MLTYRSIFACLAAAWLFCASPFASGTESSIDFATQIQPILQQHCLECHGAENREGGLLLTSRRTALLSNDSGTPGIVPGSSEESEVWHRINADDPDTQMPPDRRLSAEEIVLVRRWIDAGAEWPAGETEQHWSYSVPQPPQLPRVQDLAWSRNPIDLFVLSKLEGESLQPSSDAAPARLIRRVYLDLVGTPPPIQVVDRFVANPTDAEYQSIVDQLLASTGYGEKWASPWLDLARYSDSNGYQADQLRDMWAYRDWVITAINHDMPFDQFTIEQLAGDLLPNATISQQIATGFHRATTCNVEAGVDPEGNRTDQIIDRVNTTATVWLGTTLECAQCHNHKYDPFSQQDYYQLFAFFNNTPMEVQKSNNSNGVQFDFWGPTIDLPQSVTVVSERRELQDELQQIQAAIKIEKEEGFGGIAEWESNLSDDEREKQPKALRDALNRPAAERSNQESARIENHYWTIQPQIKEMQERIKSINQQLEQLKPDTTLVMVEMKEARESNIFLRGMFQQTGQKVSPDTPAILHPFPADGRRDRLGLAQWLVSPENPLVARVTVNRWWQELFGKGLVKTPEDFGTQADPPTHPELLDWLACELVKHDWSMKAVHRLIVTSSTYRQSSRITPELVERDPRNELLARGARFRLRAETVRDNALQISGLLSKSMTGSPAYPPQPPGLWRQTGRNEPVFTADQNERRYRRGVYVVWRRAAPYPSFVNFDAPDRMSCVVARSTTNTPLQALTLLNDEAYIEMAKALSHRTLDASNQLDEQLIHAFRLCVARQPSDLEIETLQRLYIAELERYRKDSEAVKQLAAEYGNINAITDEDRLHWAAMTSVANALLNLDETITRN